MYIKPCSLRKIFGLLISLQDVYGLFISDLRVHILYKEIAMERVTFCNKNNTFI